MARRDRSALKGRAQTVLGLIDPAELGPTLMHEHVICDITPPKIAATGVEGDGDRHLQLLADQLRPEDLGAEIQAQPGATSPSGRCARWWPPAGAPIVDLTSGGLKPDPPALAEISRDDRRAPSSWAAATTSTTTRTAQSRTQRRRLCGRDDRAGVRRRLGHGRARRHHRRDRLPGAVDASWRSG